jgi:phenylalanyl-tRNA synthetase alpha chain
MLQFFMKEQLLKIKKEVLDALNNVSDLSSLEKLEKKYLGRNGEFTLILRGLASVKGEAKKEMGSLANEIKKDLETKFLEIKNNLEGKVDNKSFVDVTLPGTKKERGHLHPITIVQRELEDLFSTMGFMVLDGPELESDYYNFESLNIPSYHPARDTQDTFYIDQKNEKGEYDLVMRTQTSAMQVRAMKKYGAPLKCIVPGRCFRSEATDVRHEHTFYQLEGLMVGEKISLCDMKGVLETIAKSLYGRDTKVRMRPKFYPFVEPGVNGEVTCFLCHGQGCRLCKNTGWLEIFGAGMVHPNVLKAGGVDPEKYSGFAFGFGLNRIVQLKYNIDDVRLFNSGDLRFIEQF